MAVATYTKSGAKASTPAKLDKYIFGVEIKNHQLLKDAYLAYLANGRGNNAVTKRRGQVSGGGKKPWRQKGTGNARVGSTRNPLWRSGGVAFGPTGQENYSRRLNTAAKRLALRQALSLAAKEERVKVIETFSVNDAKTKSAVTLLDKLSTASALVVVANIDEKTSRAIKNLAGTSLVQTKYLNAYSVLNASCIVFEKAALEALNEWLGQKEAK